MARSTVTRFGDYLQRTFGLKGSQDSMGVVPDVIPTIGLVDPTDVEHHWTRNEILWGLTVDVAAAGAGTYARVEVKANPGYITVVEGMLVTPTPATGQIAVFMLQGAFTVANIATAERMDARANTVAPPGGTAVRYGTPGLMTPNLMTVSVAPNVPTALPLGCVLNQNEILVVGTLTANQRTFFNLYGYERLAEDWERVA